MCLHSPSPAPCLTTKKECTTYVVHPMSALRPGTAKASLLQRRIWSQYLFFQDQLTVILNDYYLVDLFAQKLFHGIARLQKAHDDRVVC